VSAIIAPPIGTTNTFPEYSRILSDDDWRSDITAVARRQDDWEVGYRDADLLACPKFLRTPLHGVVLLYGSPVLLVMGDSGNLLRNLDQCEWRLHACIALDPNGPHQSYRAGILLVIDRLRHGLKALQRLNGASAPRPQAAALIKSVHA